MQPLPSDQPVVLKGDFKGQQDSHSDTNRLREFCLTILELLDNTSFKGSLASALSGELVRAIGGSVGEVADGLRGDIIAWDSAIRSLQNLPTRYLGHNADASPLVAEMEAARSFATRVAFVLETLRDASTDETQFNEIVLPQAPIRIAPPSAPIASFTSSLDEPAEPLFPISDGDSKLDDTYSPREDVTVAARLGSPVSAPQRNDTEKAAHVFDDAEACRRRHDFESAITLYTRVVQIDTHFWPAYSRRGQIRAIQNDLDSAIADFDTALSLDNTAAEAWLWRGDACTLAGRIDDAINDYTHAIEHRFDLLRAHFNLGVALRQKGDLDGAMRAFTIVIEARPTHATAFFNRGLIYLQWGDRERAVREFRTALRHDPACDQAKQQLNDIQRSSLPKQTSVADLPKAKATPGITVSLEVGKTPEPEGGKTVEVTKHSPQPRLASMKREGVVAVNCPKCGEMGEVPWDRLNRVFMCRGCLGRFGVKADGRAVELVKTPEGKWVESPVERERIKRRRKRRLALLSLGLIVLLPTVAIGGWQALAPTPQPTERELPQDLTSRVELFTQAWLCNDTRLLRRLTAPTHDKVVYNWYTRHHPPAALCSPIDGTPPEGAKIEITIVTGKQGQTTARVRVSNPAFTPTQAPADLVLTWAQQGEDWFFTPPSN
jgi:tetratricopeptide (TPR) repeat protein